MANTDNPVESTLDMARRHVIAGQRIVTRQGMLVRWMQESGRDTKEAEHTLDLFEPTLAIFEEHLASLEKRSRLPSSPTARPWVGYQRINSGAMS